MNMAVILLVVFFKLCFVSHAILIGETNGTDFMLISTPKSLLQFTIENGTQGEFQLANKKVYELDRFAVAHGIALDMKRNCLFWLDRKEGGNHTLYCNCQNATHKSEKRVTTALLSSNFSLSHTITYDWMSETLYYCHNALRKIELVKIIYGEGLSAPSSLMRRTIIDTKSSALKVVVHPKRGYLFWAEFSESGTDASISRSNLDGTGVRVLFRHPKIHTPFGLTVDLDEDRIFWADSEFLYIGSSDLNGRNVRKVAKFETGREWSVHIITLRTDHLFWFNWKNSTPIYYIGKGKPNEKSNIYSYVIKLIRCNIS